MSGLSVTEGRRPELIASNGAFHINKTHPYIFMLSPRCFFPLNFLCSDTLWVVLFAHLHCNDNFWKFYWHDLFNDSKFKIRGIEMILYLSYIGLKNLILLDTLAAFYKSFVGKLSRTNKNRSLNRGKKRNRKRWNKSVVTKSSTFCVCLYARI